MADETALSAGPRSGASNVVGWATFLACSWTWCIGMFLPVLLVRDFGFWGWVVFAVPNVVGAAAMGWTLRDADASRRMVERHAAACAAFSVITILFHVLFVGWIIAGLVGSMVAIGATAAAIVFFAAILTRHRSSERIMAGLLWLTSAGIFAVLFFIRTDRPVGGFGPTSLQNLAPLAMVCVFGFALCPYLDLTFHEARQAAGRGGRVAFSVGFGLLFALMIVFTLWYAPYLLNADRSMPGVVVRAVAAHMIAQTAFTVTVHGRSLWRVGRSKADFRTFSSVGSNASDERATEPKGAIAVSFANVVSLCAGLAIFLIVVLLRPAGHHGLAAGEVGYRLFMAFYGLVFPAYAWMHMVPRPRMTRHGPIAFLVAVLLASPFYWLGFIERRYGWLAVGVAIVLAARWIPVARSKAVR